MALEKRFALWTLLAVIATSAASFAQSASSGPGPASGGVGTLAQRIGHFDRTKTRQLVGAHDGTGTMQVQRLLGNRALSTSFQFLDEAIIDPHGGLGEHFHDNCEEMFVALEGPNAQFTIDGHTSELQTPAGAPDRMGSAHAFYNPTNRPILWLDFGVGNYGKAHDGFNLGDSRADAKLEKIPQFVNWHIDPKLLKPVDHMLGGTGTVMYRRLLGPAQFYTGWSYLDEISIPAGASIGQINEPGMSEVYFVLSGAGTVTVNGETASIKQYDAIPVDVGQAHSFAQTGTEPLHLMATGIAKDRASKRAFIERPENAGGGASRPAFPPPGRQ